MADEAEVQRKIVELAGKINRAKQARQQQQFAPATQYAQPQHSQYTSTQSYRGGYHAYGNRWDPYTAPGGRGRGGYHQTFQNRKLVNATNSATPTTTPPTSAVHTPQQQQQDVQHVGQNTKSAQHDQAPAANRELVIGGIRFLMKEDGSKLTRITDVSTSSLETPSAAFVAGVKFRRSKNQNLIRDEIKNMASEPASKPVEQCQHYTKNGVCPYGRDCRFGHDASRTAICKTFIRTGTCVKGDRCDLSHEATYNRVPACAHFLNGNCTNDACRYAHVSPSTGPLVCHPFAFFGYCEKGVDCDKQHVNECPDFAEKGDCTNPKCKLQHVRHAHKERQKARVSEDSELDEDGDDVGADAQDLDSDYLSKDVAMTGGINDIAQNKDYISLS